MWHPITINGVCYPTLKSAVDKLGNGITACALRSRLKKGIDPYTAVTMPIYRNTISKDHLGNVYPSIHAMCKHWGVRDSTFIHRIQKGMSIKKSLTAPVKSNKKNGIGGVKNEVRFSKKHP